MDKEPMIGVNVRMSAELRRTLQEWANSEGLTLSQIVRRILALSAAKWIETQNSDEFGTGSQARVVVGHSDTAK